MTFSASVLIDAPVGIVFRFHERDDALDLLLPSFPPSRVVRREGGLRPGGTVDLKIGPLNWSALHTAYEPGRFFVDEQTRGPFARWVHRHEFEDCGAWTRLTDRVEYEMAGGPLVAALFGWIVRLELKRMFRRRHRITKEFCETR